MLTALENVALPLVLDGKQKDAEARARDLAGEAWAWATGWATGPTSCRAGSSSAWRWPARWSASRR